VNAAQKGKRQSLQGFSQEQMNILQDRLPQKLKRGGSLANYGSNVQIDVAEDLSISDKKGRSLGREEEDFVADKDK
jgi:hypothetical protein